MTRPLRALVVDDEEMARKDLINYLSHYDTIEVAGEAANINAAIEQISALKPDVVFLDIQMPGGSGFKLLEKIDVDFKVVFVTAYDKYALRAFDVNALDYLLKPVNPQRLAQTLARLQGEPPAAPPPVKPPLRYDDAVLINTNKRIAMIKLNTIVYIAISGDYSELYTADGEKRVVLRSLREWLEMLPVENFSRIHRTMVINMNYLENLLPADRGRFQVCLRNCSEPLYTSRRYARELKKRFR